MATSVAQQSTAGPSSCDPEPFQTEKEAHESRQTAGPWSTTAVDAASHGAIAFCQIYYEAYDEPTRRSAVSL